MAGVAGFEPANTGVKAPRLTAWRHPNARIAPPSIQKNPLHGFLYCVSLRDEKMGWVVGFEPTASRATIWRANQLRHTHHETIMKLARLQGFEPGTYGLEGRCSIQLSYRRIQGSVSSAAAWHCQRLKSISLNQKTVNKFVGFPFRNKTRAFL